MFEKAKNSFERLSSYDPKEMSKPRTKEADVITDDMLSDAVKTNHKNREDNGKE